MPAASSVLPLRDHLHPQFGDQVSSQESSMPSQDHVRGTRGVVRVEQCVSKSHAFMKVPCMTVNYVCDDQGERG